MREGGKILSDVLWEVLGKVKPGITELELDALAQKLITKRGAESGFMKVAGYHHTICTSVNDVVVHGVPTNTRLEEGDVIGIDCGVYYKGFHTDMSETVRVGIKNQEPAWRRGRSRIKKDKIDIFLEIGKKALEAGIAKATIGNHVGDISKAIQTIVEGQGGYSIVRSLVGHGVGRNLHEEPEIPGYLAGRKERTPRLEEGMTIAIEIIYNMGKRDVVYSGQDGWTISTKDGSLSGVFERTVVVTKKGPEILTP